MPSSPVEAESAAFPTVHQRVICPGPEAQAALGAVLVRRGQDEDALVHLDRPLQLNPEELSAYVNRGEAYLKLGRRREAEADVKKAIALDPARKNTSANRARALLSNELLH